MDKLFISVIIPAYNALRYLEEALNSVLYQSYPFFEIIVVDNNSNDGTLSLLEKFGNKKLRVFTEKRQGAASTRNRGICEARGEWIAFLDADDIWLPDKLKLQIDCLGSFPWLDLISTNSFTFTLSGVEYISIRDSQIYKGECSGDLLLKRLIEYNFVATSSVLVRRSICEKVGLFKKEFEPAEDYDLWLRLAGAGAKFFFIEEPLTRFRSHPLGISYQNMEKMQRSHLEILRRNFGAYSYLFNRREIGTIFGNFYISFGHSCLNKNNPVLARRSLIHGLYYKPLYWRVILYIILSFLPKGLAVGIRKMKKTVKRGALQ